jgi:hypothetical protein
MLFADDPPAWVVSIFQGVVGAAIGAISTLLGIWVKRRRANLVRVREVEVSSILRIAATFRPHVAATFDATPVGNLSQIEMAITSDSSDPMKDISIRITFPEHTRVLQSEATLAGTTFPLVPGTSREIIVNIPLLNSHRLHRETVTLRCLTDGEPTPEKVEGRGDGWSVRWQSLRDQRRFLGWVELAIVGAVLLIAVALYCVIFAIFGSPQGDRPPPPDVWVGAFGALGAITGMVLLKWLQLKRERLKVK